MVEALAHALCDVALQSSYLGSSDPDAEAIVSLILVIEEKAKLAAELRETEWALVVKPATSAESPDVERGK